MSEDKKEGPKCMICLESVEQDHRFLPCAHVFHGECVVTWLKQKPTCPICKIPIFIESQYQLERYNRMQADAEREQARETRYLSDMVRMINRVYTSTQYAQAPEPAHAPELAPEEIDSDDDIPDLEPISAYQGGYVRTELELTMVDRLVDMLMVARVTHRDPLAMPRLIREVNTQYIQIPLSVLGVREPTPDESNSDDDITDLVPEPEPAPAPAPAPEPDDSDDSDDSDEGDDIQCELEF